MRRAFFFFSSVSRLENPHTESQVFELLTAEYLFDPQGQGELFTKDDDHMAQIIELLGDFPLDVKMGGKYSRELFDHNGRPSAPDDCLTLH